MSREKRQRGGWDSFLGELRQAYRAGGAPAAAGVWAEGKRTRWVGPIVRGIELFYPVGGVLSIAAELDGRIRDEGFSSASRRVLDRWVPGWKAVVPPKTAEVLSSAPVLVYGNHPSDLVTLFLIAATVPRADLKVVSAAFLARFFPSYAPYAISVALTRSRLTQDLWRGGVPHALVMALLRALEPAVSDEEREVINRAAMARAADHLRAGGAVVIAPAGGNPHVREWQPGVGRILHSLSREPGPVVEYLVPYHDDNSSDARIRVSLSHGPLARLWRRFYRQPVTIRYGPPTLRAELEPLPNEARDIARLLQHRYEDLFRGPRG